MTAIARRIVIMAAGIAISSMAFSAPASAKNYQIIGTCGSSVCVNAVADGHHVKSIRARTKDGLPGTLHVRWGDFRRTASGTSSRKWDVDDKMGHTRDESHRLRHSDVVCASLERLGMTVEKNVCVAV